MDIVAIEIERQDGHAFCGTLEFAHGKRVGVLLWTVEWRNTPEVMVEFFPGTGQDVTDVVRLHQKTLIDGLLDTLMQRTGKETLFT